MDLKVGLSSAGRTPDVRSIEPLEGDSLAADCEFKKFKLVFLLRSGRSNGFQEVNSLANNLLAWKTRTKTTRDDKNVME